MRRCRRKIGIGNLHGWVAYVNGDRVFIKRYKHIEGAPYSDFGSSTELFTNAITVEVETLGPLTRLEPGETVTHVEHWFLFKGIKVGETEDEIAEALEPLVQKTREIIGNSD
jgi:hypothetical protein